MKNLFLGLILTLGLCLTNNSFAQLETGILLGTSFNEMYGDNSEGYNKKGLRVGLQTDLHLSHRVALSSGLIYSQKGSIVPDKFQRHSVFQSNLHLNYLEAPLLIKYKSDHGLFVSGGLTFNKLLSIKAQSFEGPEMPFTDTANFKQWELGTIARIGYRLNDNFEIQGSWGQTLGSIYKEEIPDKNALQNNQFSVGLTFFPKF